MKTAQLKIIVALFGQKLCRRCENSNSIRLIWEISKSKMLSISQYKQITGSGMNDNTVRINTATVVSQLNRVCTMHVSRCCVLCETTQRRTRRSTTKTAWHSCGCRACVGEADWLCVRALFFFWYERKSSNANGKRNDTTKQKRTHTHTAQHSTEHIMPIEHTWTHMLEHVAHIHLQI